MSVAPLLPLALEVIIGLQLGRDKACHRKIGPQNHPPVRHTSISNIFFLVLSGFRVKILAIDTLQASHVAQ